MKSLLIQANQEGMSSSEVAELLIRFPGLARFDLSN